jgi:hypothetical protein
MTYITDSTGTRWVDVPPRKRRKASTGGRFSTIEVGDHLEMRRTITMSRGGQEIKRQGLGYAVVTDLWFDPVAGQEVPWKGQMVAIRPLYAGRSEASKQAYSRHALASVGYHKTDRDFSAECAALGDALAAGDVVPIGFARTIRRRPKMAGGL